MTPDPTADGKALSRVRQWLCGTAVVLDLVGPLSGPGVSVLRRELATALVRRSIPLLVLDATRAGDLDPDVGLVVTGAGRHAREAGGLLIVVGWPEPVPPPDGVELRATLEQALSELARTKS
ncbi:hypothetical protein [Nonomuraea sp. NPDC050783]|uniref:hypothetical protein n=1 Tax=Nonomuraea sp. NPDC050783 TaxID=3154634 RepID=UPI003464EE4E